MKARILVFSLGFFGLSIGVGQVSQSVTGSERVDRGQISSPLATATDMRHNAVTANNASPRNDDAAVESDSDSQASALSDGADIVYASIYQANTYGPVGDTYAYTLGSRTCNLGDTYLLWQNSGTPGFASNAYRLHDGRLMQIGTSWVKHACCVSNITHEVCGGVTCAPSGGSPPGTLRPGCLDTYSAGWNALQQYLGPRVNINPYTGQFAPLSGDTYTAITRRLQIHRDEMDLSNYPGALYFVEGVYVCTSSAQAGNVNNNATFRRATFNQSNFSISLAAQEHAQIPAIYAWQLHGLGVNTPDPDVQIEVHDLSNEGRFFVGSKVSDNGDGTWRYEYAVYNLNSHQAAGSFQVEIGEGVTISNVGFHSPPYHSGEPQDTTPWPHLIHADSVTWNTYEAFLQNPNANAIRWGSMHNFWFDADQPPVDRQADVGVFIPGTDLGFSFTTSGPADAPTCMGDLNGDSFVDALDLLMMLAAWTGLGECDDCGDCPADLNDDCRVDAQDLLILFGEWGECP